MDKIALKFVPLARRCWISYYPCLLILFLSLTVTSGAFAAGEIHWTVTGQTSVTFDWRGTGTENLIRYGPSAGNYTSTVTAVTPSPLPFFSSGPFWEARLTSLEEDTLYYYAISNGPERTFRTPTPRESSDFIVYSEADIGDIASYSNVGPVQNRIANGQPNFVLVAGDLSYGDSHGEAAVDQDFNDVMVWSQEAAYMPAWGNHEWDNTLGQDDLRNYKGRFDPVNPQTSPGSPSVSCCGEDWYWFDYGNVRFIIYPEPWSGTWSHWNTKAMALMDEAQADADIAFIVTWGHRPAYSSGHHPGSSTLKGILDVMGDTNNKYAVNISGHSHNYERSFPQHGVVHVTAGTGGASLEQDGSCLWLTCTQPGWSAFRAMRQGPLKLRFTDTGIEGWFICGPPGGGTNDVNCTEGSVVDKFIIGTMGPPDDDSTPPTVSITAPSAGETVSRTVIVSANASDNVGVVGVQFKLNGNNLSAEDTSNPYPVSWDTTTVADGALTLTTTVRDAAGNATTSSGVGVIEDDSRTTLTFSPTADSTIKPGSPTTNSGSGELMADASPVEHFLMKFTVSGVGLRPVTSAKLRLYNINDSNKGGDFYRVANNTWSESSVTWNNAPVADTVVRAYLEAVAVNTWHVVDLTSLITGNGTYSARVKSTSSDGADYRSKETSGFAPQLVVTVGAGGTPDTTTTPPTVSITAPSSGTVYGGTIGLITDPNLVFSVPNVPRPYYSLPITDPTFGTKVTRITGDNGSSIPGGGTWGYDARQHYAKDPVWNADQTIMVLENRGGSPNPLWLDGETYQTLNICSAADDDMYGRWHPTQPKIRIRPEGNKVAWFDVVNCSEVKSITLPFSFGSGPAGGPFSEGTPSNDGRYAALAKDGDETFVVDMDPSIGSPRVGPNYNVASCRLSDCGIDWVAISPSGKYAVVQHEGDHARVFDVDPTTLALTPRPMPSASPQCGAGQTAAAGYIYNVGHADMAMNPFDNDEDVIVGQKRSWCPSTVKGISMGSVVLVRLKDNKVTTLTHPSNEGYSYHVSTRNLARPGWAYVGYWPTSSSKRFNDEIIAVKMDGSKSVERLAHQHSDSSGCYRCEPHPVPSPDGRRVIWASSWTLNCGSSCGSKSDIKAYIVDTRPQG